MDCLLQLLKLEVKEDFVILCLIFLIAALSIIVGSFYKSLKMKFFVTIVLSVAIVISLTFQLAAGAHC